MRRSPVEEYIGVTGGEGSVGWAAVLGFDVVDGVVHVVVVLSDVACNKRELQSGRYRSWTQQHGTRLQYELQMDGRYWVGVTIRLHGMV